MLLSIDEVKTYLPHRAPFLFIDTVLSVTPPSGLELLKEITPKDLVDTKVIAYFKVRDNLEILQGHFPGAPILPGVIQVEMIAQASAFVSLASNNLKIDGINAETLLLGAEAAKFRKPIYPGMTVEIHSRMAKCRGPVASYAGEIFVEGEKYSEANILAKLIIHRHLK